MGKLLFALAVVAVSAASASGQGLPTGPVSLADGRVVLGAEVTATIGGEDPGFFNYTDYEYSALRNVRIGVGAQLRASRHLQVLGELRVDHAETVQALALYARVRPWPERRFDIQVGRVPPTFGAFSRGGYGTGNLLIGTPLAYQYLTSLRTDAVPVSASDLLRMRGRGWLSSFPVGAAAPAPGLPLVNTNRWDTGIQVHGITGIVEWTGAITTGSLSNPRVDDDNDGRQLAGRVVTRPRPSIALGLSMARGAYLDASLERALPVGVSVHAAAQQAVGLDAEYSIGRFLARGEWIRSQWTLPLPLADTGERRVHATTLLGEARYRVYPGVQIAARVERLDFSRLAASGRARWEAPVDRVEIGGSYALLRNVLVKASWQHNRRDGGRIRRASLGAVQVVYWF